MHPAEEHTQMAEEYRMEIIKYIESIDDLEVLKEIYAHTQKLYLESLDWKERHFSVPFFNVCRY